MSNIAVRVNGLSKQYCIGGTKVPYHTLRETLTNSVTAPFRRLASMLQRSNVPSPNGDNTIWALKDVSFEIEPGEIVGIIGRNGAGKSTLLKILSRITAPTTGFAEIHGRVGSLLEVGTGFHSELSGRENIYLNGAILGMRKAEIDRKFDEIVAFAEVEKFIDTPVKHYSSGMSVRLAFAVGAHLEPEVLIVDEVLAVGDAGFQKKCLGKMEGVAEEGRTVLFVSHNMAAVEHLCNRVVILQDGKLAFNGGTKEGIDYYLRSVAGEERASRTHIVDLSTAAGRPRKYRPILKRLELFTGDGRPMNGSLKIGAPLRACVLFGLQKPTANFDVALGLDNHLGQRVFTASTRYQPDRPKVERVGDQMFVCDIPSLPLVPGEYRIKVFFNSGENLDRVEDAARFTVIESDYYGTGKVPNEGFFVLTHHWHLTDPDQGKGITEKGPQ